jgi:hypothetical protein
VLSYPLSEEALKSMQGYMLQHIGNFCSLLESPEPINMSKLTEYLSKDIIAELAFGQSLGMLLGPKNRPVADFMITSTLSRQIVTCTSLRMVSPHLD